MNKKKVIISIVILIIDQITKSFAHLYAWDINVIGSMLRFSYYQNTGAAWSILEGKQTFLILISLAMLVLIFNMMFSYEENKLNNLAFGLLTGGIVGNLIDRIFYGYVRDFLEVNLFGYTFPIFNIADMAIVIGVIVLVCVTIKGEYKHGSNCRRKRIQNR